MAIKDIILYRKYPNFPQERVNFIDLTPSFLNTEVTNTIIKQLMELYVGNDKIDYIISPDARGFIWGSMLSSVNYKTELFYVYH